MLPRAHGYMPRGFLLEKNHILRVIKRQWNESTDAVLFNRQDRNSTSRALKRCNQICYASS